MNRLFFIEGVRNFVRVADLKFDIATILFSEKLLTAPLARKPVRQLRRAGVPTLNLTPEQFRHDCHAIGASPDGSICISFSFRDRLSYF